MNMAFACHETLHDLAVACGLEMAHFGAAGRGSRNIEQVKLAFLAAGDQQIGAGNQQRAGRPQIVIFGIKIGLIKRREPVHDGAVGRQFDEAIAVTFAAGIGVESAVAGDRIKIAARVRR